MALLHLLQQFPKTRHRHDSGGQDEGSVSDDDETLLCVHSGGQTVQQARSAWGWSSRWWVIGLALLATVVCR